MQRMCSNTRAFLSIDSFKKGYPFHLILFAILYRPTGAQCVNLRKIGSLETWLSQNGILVNKLQLVLPRRHTDVYCVIFVTKVK